MHESYKFYLLHVEGFVVHTKLEKVAINDASPLKAAQRDTIAKLKSLWGFESELRTNSMPFHLDSPWGATLM